jgi:hypothetical protein
VLSTAQVTQARMAELLADRVDWVTTAPPGPDDVTVLVVLRSFDPAELARGARRFAAVLDRDEAAAWRRSWTRTRFLFGNPANLPGGLARVVTPDGAAAWLGPHPHARPPGPSRLLKPVTGELPALPRDVRVAGTGRERVLQLAVAGLTLVDYLVHLHHTVAEAVLRGRLGQDDALLLSHRPTVAPDRPDHDPAHARVLPEPGDTGRLLLHTWLTA